MTDETAEPTAIEQTTTPNPVETSTPTRDTDEESIGQPPSGAERKSLEETIKAADAKARQEADEKGKPKDKPEAKEKEPEKPKKEEAQPKEEDAKSAPERGPDGKFLSREAKPEGEPSEKAAPGEPPAQRAPHHDAPPRFDDAAKLEWEGVPESVKGATHRVLREMENGIQKYRADAESYEEIRDFADLAEQNGTTVRSALENYTNINRALISQDQQTKDGALQHLFQVAGVNPREWAAKVTGQTPEQVETEQNQTISSLRQQVQQLTQQVSHVAQGFQQQQQRSIESEVSAFAEQNGRFDELSSDIKFFLENGRASTLPEAYELAERLNPAPQAAKPQEAAHTGEIQERAHTPPPVNPAGSKSVAGAPASGSDPVIPAKRNGQPPSITDALKRAAARAAS